MRRRITHHLTLAAASIACGIIVVLVLDSPDPVFGLSMATAYVGLGLLAFTLVLGPWNVLRSRPNPVSTHLRRDVGIWAALVALAHVLVGFQRHFSGDWLRWFRNPASPMPGGLRVDVFGAGSWTGLAAGLLLLVLLGLSNDVSLRRLGTKRWKWWQRWNYAVFPAVLVHGVVFQAIEQRESWWIALTILIALSVCVTQALGFQRRRSTR